MVLVTQNAIRAVRVERFCLEKKYTITMKYYVEMQASCHDKIKNRNFYVGIYSSHTGCNRMLFKRLAKFVKIIRLANNLRNIIYVGTHVSKYTQN